MNSSGIKRGLATTAVSALAIAGLPLFASSASAATGDVIQVAFTGPALNGGADGAVVVLKTKGIADGELGELKLVATDLSGTANASQNNANQTLAIVGTPTRIADAAGNEFGGADGFDEITVRVAATTPAAGSTANFAIYLDDDSNVGVDQNNRVDASEARAQVSLTTTGPVASLDVSPTSQTAAVGQPSGNYVVTPRDAQGRATQITSNIVLTNEAGSNDNTGSAITPAEAARGTAAFTLTGSAAQLYTTTLAGANGSSARVTLDVTPGTAALTANEIDIVTAADSWNGLGGDEADETIPGTVQVRVDQGSVRLDIVSTTPATDKGTTATFTVSSAQMTFGGKSSITLSTVLDANGKGSVTITPDAGTIQENDTLEVVGFDRADNTKKVTVQFVRAALSNVVAGAQTYVSKVNGSVDVTVTAVDQFGLPVAGAYIDAKRATSDSAYSAKKVSDAQGQATFTFSNTNAVPGTQENVDFRAFVDQFDTTNRDGDAADTVIRYTVDGLGDNFTLTADGNTAGGSAYNPANVTTNPLTDGTIDAPAGNGDPQYIALNIVGGTVGTTVTVSADNGALVLRDNETTLPQGSASDSVVITGGSTAFRIVGTKTGLTTVTVTSSGITKTVQFTTVRPTGAGSTADARNVAVSGPTEAVSGEIATFTAVVTDAFGNGVAGVPVSALNVQVSGPGRLQDSGAVTDANGSVPLNVRLDEDADSQVTVQVTGVPSAAYQFGSAANQLTPTSNPNTAPGISASSNVATATLSSITNIAELEQAVEDAEAAVEAAQAALTAANNNLDVAEATLAAAKAKVATLKQKLKKAKQADKKAKVKRLKKRLAAAKAARAEAAAAVVSAQTAVDGAQATLTQAQADLDEAEQNLEDAQS